MTRRHRIVTILPWRNTLRAGLDAPAQLFVHLAHAPLLLFPLETVDVALHAHHLAELVCQKAFRLLHGPVHIGLEVRGQLLHSLAREAFLGGAGGGVLISLRRFEIPGIQLSLLHRQERGLEDLRCPGGASCRSLVEFLLPCQNPGVALPALQSPLRPAE